jgi:hypothetical protein
MMRRFGCALSAFLVLIVAGCQSAPKSGSAARQAAAPDLSEYRITTVAILDIVNSTDDEKAGGKMAAHLEPLLKAGGGYAYLGMYETTGRASRAGAVDDLTRLRSDWKTTRKLDPAIVVRFGQAVGAQAILAADLLTWASEKVEWNVEGRSYSRVNCRITLFETRTGAPVWSHQEETLLESAHYDPSAQANLGDQSGVPTTEIVNRAPEPPDVEEAARQTAEKLVAAIPKAVATQ